MIEHLLLILMAVALCWLTHHYCAEREAKLLEQISDLRQDNRALTEALSRPTSTPVIFAPPKPEPSVGWFDGKTFIKPAEKAEK